MTGMAWIRTLKHIQWIPNIRYYPHCSSLPCVFSENCSVRCFIREREIEREREKERERDSSLCTSSSSVQTITDALDFKIVLRRHRMFLAMRR